MKIDLSSGDHPGHPPAVRPTVCIPYCIDRFLPHRLVINDPTENFSRQKLTQHHIWEKRLKNFGHFLGYTGIESGEFW